MRLILKKTSTFCNLVNKEFTDKFDEPNFAHLKSRGIIIASGPETKKFMQGLTTNNVMQLYQKKNVEKIAIYTLFLSPKGKVVSDAFIIRPQIFEKGVKKFADDELWIDVSRQTCSNLFEHLRKYTWKKQVQLTNLTYEEDFPEIIAGFNKVVPDELSNLDEFNSQCGVAFNIESEKLKKPEAIDDGSYANLSFFDPRGVKFGLRMVCAPNGFIYKGTIKKVPEEEYNKVCSLNGISSSQAMVSKLPFMFNSDIFNGFSFSKGCYLGQQIVARAYFTGIVRRRIFPFQLDTPTKIEPGQTIYGQGKVQLGKVVESGQGYGTVLCNYLPLLDSKWPLGIEAPVKGKLKIPFRKLLNKYIEDIKSKQAKLQQIDL